MVNTTNDVPIKVKKKNNIALLKFYNYSGIWWRSKIPLYLYKLFIEFEAEADADMLAL